MLLPPRSRAGSGVCNVTYPPTPTAILSYQAPDLILVNGRLVTVDREFSLAEAVAIKDGRIVGVGAASDVRALAGRRTETIDLGGRMVLPGLIDSHCHPYMCGLRQVKVNLMECPVDRRGALDRRRPGRYHAARRLGQGPASAGVRTGWPRSGCRRARSSTASRPTTPRSWRTSATSSCSTRRRSGRPASPETQRTRPAARIGRDASGELICQDGEILIAPEPLA